MKIYNYVEDRFYSLTSEETERMFSECEEQKEFAQKFSYDDTDILKKMKDSDILAERKMRGISKRARTYNRRLKEAQYQAKRREAKDWKMNNINREGYSF